MKSLTSICIGSYLIFLVIGFSDWGTFSWDAYLRGASLGVLAGYFFNKQ
ncbi:hypothetical protein LCGC14_0396400 [marine sediment metagenome]|uniref:Uncharacterized protein n=1 Tax=marine sediment metagenome TaxID=412755 RepID=A0A0F9W745_9ZZZZ